MPRLLNKFPEPEPSKQSQYGELRVPQIRVLQVLVANPHAMTRGEISEQTGNKTDVMVGRAIGYSDPVKRAAFEQTKDGGFTASLLTLKYVTEHRLEIEEGVFETRYNVTPAGRKALANLGDIELPPIDN